MKRKWNRLKKKLSFGILLGLCSLGVGYQFFEKVGTPAATRTLDPQTVFAATTTDDAGARAAFEAAAVVFFHPRCMNCHPSGDVPLQGDESRLHAQNVKRGPDGHGKYALKCSNCHQQTNLPGENMPPGNPNWHLPPPKTRMVFQGKTPGGLCRQLKDPAQNGRKTVDEIIHHVAEDSLVLWGWNPGEGRTLPPLSHQQFVRLMKEWAGKGASCPS